MTRQLLHLPLNTEKINTKTEHIKLDNKIVTNTELLQELRQYLEEQMTQTANMNTHMKLEFAKMTIRTVANAMFSLLKLLIYEPYLLCLSRLEWLG